MGNMEEEYVARLVEDFKKSKEAIETLEKRQNEMKKELSALVDTNGYEDDKGHRWLEIGGYELKRERRVSRVFDSHSAEFWARENGYWEKIMEVREVISEDKLLGLAWSNPELSEIIQKFYSEKESWAFKV
jgi:hypothetical protein